MKYLKFIILSFVILFISACSNTSETIVLSANDKKVVLSSSEFSNEYSANVKIYNNQYSKFLGITYKEKTTHGSGFIYRTVDNSYYCLTNYHVINLDNSFNDNEISVEDYLGNEYDGEVIYSNINYDLAVIKFEKVIDLNILEISKENEKSRNNIKVISNPKEEKNVVSEGIITCYSYITYSSNNSSIDFEVIAHNALIQKGSSGSVLLNDNNEVIGINFAGVFNQDGKFVTGYAIPSVKINEFLENM